MARPLRNPEDPAAGLDGQEIMPYGSYTVGKNGCPWQLCYCGHEFEPGETMFSIPEAGWVCLRCASRAYYGDNIIKPRVYILPGTAGNKILRLVPQWWAELHELAWYGKDGPPDYVKERVEESRLEDKERRERQAAADEEAKKRREQVMAEPAVDKAKVTMKGLF